MVLNWALGFSKQQKSVRGPPGVPGTGFTGACARAQGRQQEGKNPPADSLEERLRRVFKRHLGGKRVPRKHVVDLFAPVHVKLMLLHVSHV